MLTCCPEKQHGLISVLLCLCCCLICKSVTVVGPHTRPSSSQESHDYLLMKELVRDLLTVTDKLHWRDACNQGA